MLYFFFFSLWDLADPGLFKESEDREGFYRVKNEWDSMYEGAL